MRKSNFEHQKGVIDHITKHNEKKESEEFLAYREAAEKEYQRLIGNGPDEEILFYKRFSGEEKLSSLEKNKDINTRLEVWSFEVNDADLEKIGITDLEPGVGLKGGAARALLMDKIGMDYVEKPRDVDPLIKVRQFSEHALEEVVTKYMGQEVGYMGLDRAIEFSTFKGVFEHMWEQDFTMNEVMYMDGTLYATKEAVHDLKYGIIRVTEYEKRRWSQNAPKMITKMMRLWARWEVDRGEAELANPEVIDFGIIPKFWIYLNAEKADQEGNKVAQAFWDKIIDQIKNTDSYVDLNPELVSFIRDNDVNAKNLFISFAMKRIYDDDVMNDERSWDIINAIAEENQDFKVIHWELDKEFFVDIDLIEEEMTYRNWYEKPVEEQNENEQKMEVQKEDQKWIPRVEVTFGKPNRNKNVKRELKRNEEI